MSFRLLCLAVIMSGQNAMAEIGSMETTGPYLVPASTRLVTLVPGEPQEDEPQELILAPPARYNSIYSAQSGSENISGNISEGGSHSVRRTDQLVQPAVHTEPIVPANVDNVDSERRLLRPSAKSSGPFSLSSRTAERKTKRLIPKIPISATVTTIGGMSLVIGLFLLSIWLVKRGMPKSNSVLPEDVVSLLGRRQLSARQTMQMLRVGNKLVLVSVTPDGTEPITEVTDPAEVDRILGLCQQSQGQSSTAEFQHVLDQLTREPSGRGMFSQGAHASSAHASGSQLG